MVPGTSVGVPEKGAWESSARFSSGSNNGRPDWNNTFSTPFPTQHTHRRYASRQNTDDTGSASVRRRESRHIVPLTAISFHNLGKIIRLPTSPLWHVFPRVLLKLVL